MSATSSLLERLDTSLNDVVHFTCNKCDHEYSVCGVPRLDRRILSGKGNCKECKELMARGEHV